MNCDNERGHRFNGISVVIPFFDNERSINHVYNELVAVLGALGAEYELIFVNDGSLDSTPERLEDIWCRDDRVTVLHFSCNFGQRAAWTAGLAEARGNIVVTMDGDGQLDPADIPKFIGFMKQGHDIVSGWRKERKDPGLRKLGSRLANYSVRRLGKLKVKDFGCSLRAYRGEFLDQLDFGPHRLYDKAAALSLTDAIIDVPVHHNPPTHSGWRVINLVRYGVDNLLTFGDQFFLRVGLWAAASTLIPLLAAAVALFGVDLAPFSVPLILFSLVLLTGLLSLVGLAAARAIREARGQNCYWVKRKSARRRRYPEEL